MIGFFVVAFFGLGLLAARDLRSLVEQRLTRPEQVFAAAHEFVTRQADFKTPATFAKLAESEVEQWSGRRWRVAGHASVSDASGAPVRVLYSCVMVYDGRQWFLEEIHLENLR